MADEVDLKSLLVRGPLIWEIVAEVDRRLLDVTSPVREIVPLIVPNVEDVDLKLLAVVSPVRVTVVVVAPIVTVEVPTEKKVAD